MHTREQQQIEAVNRAAAQLPGLFYLRGHPGRICRVNGQLSYLDDGDRVVLVVEVYASNVDGWLSFSKGSLADIQGELIKL